MKLLYVVIAISLVVLPVYAGTFRDDFENEEDFLNDKQLREGGVWGEDITFYTWENGAIKGRNDLAGFFVALITGDYGWKDYTVEFRAKIITDFDFDLDAIALLLRRQCIDCNDVYFFVIGRTPGGTNKVGIVGKDPENPLVGAPFQMSKDVWYTFKGVVQGEQLEFYVDDELVLEAEDDAFASGKAGFAVQNAGGEPMEALFDDFAMTGPEVKDGGHWKGQPQSKAVSSYSKLANMWGNIKNNYLDNVELEVGLRYLAIHTRSGKLTGFIASNWDSVSLTQPTKKFNIVKIVNQAIFNLRIVI